MNSALRSGCRACCCLEQASAAAAATAAARGALEVAGDVFLQDAVLLLERFERGAVGAIFQAADALAQRFVVLGLAGKSGVFLAQFQQLCLFLGKVIAQGVM